MRCRASLLLLVAVVVSGCGVYDRINAEMFKNDRAVRTSPADVGLPAEELAIAVEDRVLHGYFVPAAATKSQAAVLIFHGVNCTVEDWVDDVRVFHDAGMPAMVFDYSAYGRSTGEPDVHALRVDGAAAIAAFRERTQGCHRLVLAHSLGVAIALESLELDRKQIDGLVLMSGWRDWRGWLVDSERISSFSSWFLPALFESTELLSKIKLPTLIVHGARDEVFDVSNARALHAAAGTSGELLLVPDMAHDPGEADAARDPWATILMWVQAQASAFVPRTSSSSPMSPARRVDRGVAAAELGYRRAVLSQHLALAAHRSPI